MLYRITHNGIGIFSELFHPSRKLFSDEDFENFKSAYEWLPRAKLKDNKYKESYRSYFTELGYDKFNKTILPYFQKLYDKDSIKVDEVPETQFSPDMLVYEDKYQKIYDLSKGNVLTEEYLELLNEVYFGKTDSILEIEETLDKIRKSYIGTNNIPKNDSIVNKFNKLIAKQFGLKYFVLSIIFDPVPGMTSVPITTKLFSNDSNIIIDKDTYKFKPESGCTCILNITTGLIFSKEFTTEEIMAGILYQLGYMFFSGFSKNNSILANIYTATNIATSIANTVQQIYYTKNVGSFIEKKIINRLWVDADKLTSLPKEELIKMFPKMDIANMTPEDIAKGMQVFSDFQNNELKKAAHFNSSIIANSLLVKIIISCCTENPLYKWFINLFKKEYENDSKVKSVSIGFIEYIKLFFSKTIDGINSIINKAVAIIGSGQTFGLIDLLSSCKTTIAAMKNPLNWLFTPIAYNIDVGANNFATMYGYSAAQISYFEKMNSNNNVKLLGYFIKKHSWLGLIYDVVMLPSKILSSVFDYTPSGLARCVNQIKYLENELAKQDIPSEVRQSISSDIATCYNALNKLKDISKSIKDPDIIKKLYNKALYDCLGSVGLKDELLNINNY